MTVKTTKRDQYAPPYRWRQKLKAWMRLQQWKRIQKAIQYFEGAEPVRRGQWINRGYVCGEYDWECSACGESEWRGSTIGLHYCPNCGAKMDEQWGGENKEGCQWH